MNITTVFIISLIVFFLLNYLVLPNIRVQIEKDLSPSVILPYARFHLFSILRTIALANMLGAGIIMTVLWVLNLQNIATVDEVSSVIGKFERIRNFAETASSGFSMFLMAAVSSTLAWLSYVQSKQHATILFQNCYEAERDRLITAYENDEWEELEPDESLKEIAHAYNDRQRLLVEAEANKHLSSIETLKGELAELSQLHFAYDLRRRLKLQLSEPLSGDLLLPVSANWKDKLRNAVVNRGVLKSLKGVSRALVFVCMISLLPAATSINLAFSLDGLQSKLLKLDELRVDLSTKFDQEKFAEAINDPPSIPAKPGELPSDDEAVEQLSNNFELAFHQSYFGQNLSANDHLQLERDGLRKQLLSDFAPAGSSKSVAVQNSIAVDQPLFEKAKENFKLQLHKIRKENERAWVALKAALPSGGDFSSNVMRSELKQTLANELFKTATSDISSDLLRAYDHHGDVYLTEILKGSSLEQAIRNGFKETQHTIWTKNAEEQLRTLKPLAGADGGVFDRTVRDNPPTLHTPVMPVEEYKIAEKILATAPENLRSAQVLFEFGDLLPGSFGAETHTSAADASQKLEGRRLDILPPSKPSRVAFNRSFSYKSLSGFARVGGVLIGKKPENEKLILDVRDFYWSKNTDGTLQLSLIDSASKHHTFGPYSGALLRQALAYAADQRPLAVTMITAPPVPDFKIIAHPALVDKSVGCRAIKIDRIVDEATSGVQFRTKATKLVEASDHIYRLAWSVALKKTLESAKLNPTEEKNLVMVGMNVGSTALNELAKAYSALRPSLAHLTETPVVSKVEFYHPAISKTAGTCVAASKTVETLLNCLQQNTASIDLETLLKRLPTFQIWSGVREQPYKLDTNFNFLRQPKGNSLWPFDFILQTAFTEKGLMSDEEFVDDNPWEFPAIHDQLLQDVKTLVSSSPQKTNLINDMREFVVVQRIFRLALDGKMGTNFPVNKLALLSRDLNKNYSQNSPYTTPRWNTRIGLELQLLKNMATESDREFKSESVIKLAKMASGVVSSCKKNTADQRAWENSKSANEGCNLIELQKAAAKVSKNSSISDSESKFAETINGYSTILALRRELGVYSSENKNVDTCPAL